MPIRITGMNSGMDTEAIISDLVSAYQKKTDKYTKAQSRVSWKQEAWKNMSAKTYSFRTSLDGMRFASAYQLKKTSVSNSTKAAITAGNNAVNGTQTLEIKSLAKTGYLTGGKMETAWGGKVAAKMTMAEMGFFEEGSISINGKQIEINSATKVSDVITKLNDAGVVANFDEKNQRIFVSAKESGKGTDFSLTALNESGAKALSKLGLLVRPEGSDAIYQQYVDDFGGKTPDELKEVLQNYDTTAANADKLIADYAKQYQNADETTKGVVLEEFTNLIHDVTKVAKAIDEQMGYNTDAVRIYGQDAMIKLNGAEFTSTGNSFSINGLTIDALATTAEGETLTVTTSTDNQGIYDKIKDFLSDYNELINSMTSGFNADKSTKDYDPLTEEEKAEMSESEIEKWEEKGKSGVLRRDSTLNTLIGVMTGAMSKSYKVNGKNYALSSFGIKTLGIMNAEKNEHNAYHIDGDADDEEVSTNADKLMAAIIDDPEGVMGFFQKLSTDLYDNLGKQMTSTTLRSYGTFYNDKEMEREYNDYTNTIKKWEEKVADIEDSYYKKFAAMESAMAKLNSQTSQLSGLLG